MTEIILLVDSNPMGLKLAAALLRAEGYEPRLASSGELALSMLVTLRPSAILVDLQLIGMDAWELARRIREDPLVSDTPVLAVIGSAAQDRHRITNTAVFRATISKPLDGRTLGVQLRKILAEGVNTAPIDYAAPTREAPPVQRTLPRRTAEGETELADLTHEFLEDGYRHALALVEAIDTFPSRQARFLVQQWIGTAESLGYREILATARELEEVLEAPLWDRARTALLLTNLSHGFRDPIHAASPEEVDALTQGLKGERIALVGLGQREAERACIGLRRAGVRPYLFDENEPPASEAIQNCSAVIVQVRPETAQSAWLRPKLVMREPKVLVLMGTRTDILALDPAVQARAHDFLIDDWAPEEVVLRVGFGRARAARKMADRTVPEPETSPQPEEGLPRTVVVAIENRALRTALARAAAEAAIECLFAADGAEALETIRQRRSGAAVLDVALPGMDAFALLARIRAEKLPVKALLLTANANCEEMVEGFKLGAFDCMVQPVNPREFEARMARLLSP
ncbi:MAG: response regulator [Bryobacteraceae bacterium]|jgi:two-component system response regulator MprA